MTGLRAAMLPLNARLAAAGRVLERERTFSDRPPGAAFWYENSHAVWGAMFIGAQGRYLARTAIVTGACPSGRTKR